MPILSAKKDGQHGRIVDQVACGIACQAPGELGDVFQPVVFQPIGFVHAAIVSNPRRHGRDLGGQKLTAIGGAMS
jgi:hypothetical protein